MCFGVAILGAILFPVFAQARREALRRAGRLQPSYGSPAVTAQTDAYAHKVNKIMARLSPIQKKIDNLEDELTADLSKDAPKDKLDSLHQEIQEEADIYRSIEALFVPKGAEKTHRSLEAMFDAILKVNKGYEDAIIHHDPKKMQAADEIGQHVTELARKAQKDVDSLSP